MSGILKLGSVTLGTENSGKVDLTNVGATSADSVTATNLTGTVTNLSSSLTALDTSASNGATSNLDNTALPLFGCRAFVNFNGSTDIQTVGGEEHCQIRSSGNISKVVRIADPGKYEIFFSTPMPDDNYCVTVGAQNGGSNSNACYILVNTLTTTSFQVWAVHTASYQNIPIVCLTIFR